MSIVRVPFFNHQKKLFSPFFDRSDWLSFLITSITSLSIYLLTLPPNVTLEFSGIFSTGAMYAGVAHPPGFPVWTVYTWLFTKLVPFSNIAWRVSVASSVAGALTCGVVALMVSRTTGSIFRKIENPFFSSNEQKLTRIACGWISGFGFGFTRESWKNAIKGEPWSLTMFLFSLGLCFLLQWSYRHHRNKYLYIAFFLYGLTVTNSQSMLVAAPGIISLIPIVIGFRGLIKKWKVFLIAIVFFIAAFSVYLYLPIASMTNPPVNWGYPRTTEGFLHTISRGQYERIHPTDNVNQFIAQIWLYTTFSFKELGWAYLLISGIPICCVKKMHAQERKWILSLLGLLMTVTVGMLIILNPGSDRQSVELTGIFFGASHLILAILAGVGVVFVVIFFVRRQKVV